MKLLRQHNVTMRVFVSLAILLIAVTKAMAESFTFNASTDKEYVYRKDDCYFSFVKAPWKCILLTEKGDTLLTAY